MLANFAFLNALHTPLCTSSPLLSTALFVSNPAVPGIWEGWLRDALSTKNPSRVMEGNLSAGLLLISSGEDLSDLGMLDPDCVGERECSNVDGRGNGRCVPAEDELNNGSGTLPFRGLPLLASISKVLAEPGVIESAASLPSIDPHS